MQNNEDSDVNENSVQSDDPQNMAYVSNQGIYFDFPLWHGQRFRIHCEGSPQDQLLRVRCDEGNWQVEYTNSQLGCLNGLTTLPSNFMLVYKLSLARLQLNQLAEFRVWFEGVAVVLFGWYIHALLAYVAQIEKKITQPDLNAPGVHKKAVVHDDGSSTLYIVIISLCAGLVVLLGMLYLSKMYIRGELTERDEEKKWKKSDGISLHRVPFTCWRLRAVS